MLSKDFKEFVGLLNKHKVKYLVVGGYAVAAHGHPRFTKDLDVWILVDEPNANNIVHVLDDFGFGSLGLNVGDFLEDGQVIQLGQPPCRIDILTSASGVDFGTCHSRRMNIDIDGISTSFIDLDSLLMNKKATGRLQDLADIEALVTR